MKKITPFILITLLIFSLPVSLSARNGFYSLGSERLEFRIVQTVNNDQSIEVYDQNKSPYFVCKTPVLKNNDIEDIYVETDHNQTATSKLRNISSEYRATVYFKKSSWLKVREFSEQNLSRQVAIIKRNMVLLTPIIKRPFADKAEFFFDQAAFNIFMPGLTPVQTTYSELEREKAYLKWLQKEIANSEKWIDDLVDYANRDLRAKKSKEVIAIFQRILKYYPSKSKFLEPLGDCFFKLKDYDSALIAYLKALRSHPDNRLRVRLKIVWCYMDQVNNIFSR